MKNRFIVQKILFIFLLFSSCQPGEGLINKDLEFQVLLCEYQEDPLGIDNPAPRLTWMMGNTIPGGFQTAYQVMVSDSPEELGKNMGSIWDSGKIFSGRSTQVEYQGHTLETGKRYYWKVRIWDQADQPSAFSEMAWWEMGLLEPEAWSSEWISAPRVFDWAKKDQQRKDLSRNAPPEMGERAPLFRKVISTGDSILKARLYISGLGYYEMYLNGQKVGDHVLDPAFTDYDKTVLYATYDMTHSLQAGDNVLGIILGNGWYNMASRGVWSFDRAPWRDDPALKLMLRIEYTDGTVQQIRSDSTWKCSPSPVFFNSIRQGEFYDARLEQPGWSEPGFDDGQWQAVRIVPGPKGTLTSQIMPPIKIMDKLSPVSIRRTLKNTWVCDFGQNTAGFAELSLSLPAGKRIRLKYGEKLYPNGTVDQSNIDGLVAQDPFQTDEYITRGGSKEIWHPRFVYHGFQYVEVEGFPGELSDENIRACVVHTAFRKKGHFECSNDLLNQIQHNTEWSFVNNFHGYPTDCPHREKNGWTGDAQLANDMALFNYEVERAYDKWLNDIVDSQLESGIIPAIVPTGGWGYHWGNGPAWDYALFILPWNMYVYAGDSQVLKKYYPNIQKYLEFLSGTTDDWIIRWGLGDWVPVKTTTPPELITTAYFYQQCQVAAKMAETLGYYEDQEKYLNMAEKIRKAFNKHFVMKVPPWIGNGSQTSLGCALYFSLLDSTHAEVALQQLINNVRASDLNLDFGVLGSKFVPNALARAGRVDIAYTMINTTNFPGWGNWVSRGATTLWEDWKGESSRNHVFFGDVSAWFYNYLAGIIPDDKIPGFKHFYIAPHFPEDLQWVKAHTDSYHGRIESNWKKEGSSTILNVYIPFNTSATIRLDKVRNIRIQESDSGDELKPEIIKTSGEKFEMMLKAGTYELVLEK
jgi:alpha-L-rhamnosidase